MKKKINLIVEHFSHIITNLNQRYEFMFLNNHI